MVDCAEHKWMKLRRSKYNYAATLCFLNIDQSTKKPLFGYVKFMKIVVQLIKLWSI